jgi:hypothetical protein
MISNFLRLPGFAGDIDAGTYFRVVILRHPKWRNAMLRKQILLKKRFRNEINAKRNK